MTLEEIKAAVDAGKTVHWANESYRVIHDSVGQWLIIHDGGYCVGLTWRDGKTVNGNLDEFYVADNG